MAMREFSRYENVADARCLAGGFHLIDQKIHSVVESLQGHEGRDVDCPEAMANAAGGTVLRPLYLRPYAGSGQDAGKYLEGQRKTVALVSAERSFRNLNPVAPRSVSTSTRSARPMATASPGRRCCCSNMISSSRVANPRWRQWPQAAR